ncbi:MAG: helix-turn-helix transcriptional regulator [Oscillospiraceae bacterium]|nr:helix-turn-helix transcriptional regulator [Oscillospiraceae bacterium]
MNYRAYLILRERLKKNWSQEGLCKGICTVSYLSKIESGKAVPSEQIMKMLLERLQLEYSPELERKACQLAEKGFEQLLGFRFDELERLLANADLARLKVTASGLELELLDAARAMNKALDKELEVCMDNRSLAIQRIMQGREDEAAKIYPCAYTVLVCGISAYVDGNFSKALDRLQSAYQLAAEEGRAEIMLQCKLFMGNSFCNQQDFDNMLRHYTVARRLAESIGDRRSIEAIEYNTASAWVEAGRYEEAYAWFSALEAPGLMSMHKLAICCEKTGRIEEGLCALDRAEKMRQEDIKPELAEQMCALVRYRLEHPEYLSCEEYGEMLISCFESCRTELGSGYAIFHLPWVIEWYKATRQYKKAYQVLEDFPAARR